MSDFFDKFRKKETVIAAGPSPIWHGVPGTQATGPAPGSPGNALPQPIHQPPVPVANTEFTFQPRPQPLSVAPAQPKAMATDTPATVVYPRAVPNTGPGSQPTNIGPAFGPYAARQAKNDDDESITSVLRTSGLDAEDTFVKTKQMVLEKLGKAQISELPFVKPKLDKLHHTYKEFEHLTEHVKRLWICVRDIRDTQKFFTEAASTEEEFVKDTLDEMATAFSSTYKYGDELYNTLKSLKETTETFYNAAIADAKWTAAEYEKRRVAYDATRQRVAEMQQDAKTDPVTLRNAQNNLEVKRTEFQQVGADLATKMIILNEKRIQILSERLKEYYTVMRKYYSNCATTFGKIAHGGVNLPIDSSFGTTKFKDLITSLRSEREVLKKGEGAAVENKEKEKEELEWSARDAPATSTPIPTPTPVPTQIPTQTQPQTPVPMQPPAPMQPQKFEQQPFQPQQTFAAPSIAVAQLLKRPTQPQPQQTPPHDGDFQQTPPQQSELAPDSGQDQAQAFEQSPPLQQSFGDGSPQQAPSPQQSFGIAQDHVFDQTPSTSAPPQPQQQVFDINVLSQQPSNDKPEGGS